MLWTLQGADRGQERLWYQVPNAYLGIVERVDEVGNQRGQMWLD